MHTKGPKPPGKGGLYTHIAFSPGTHMCRHKAWRGICQHGTCTSSNMALAPAQPCFPFPLGQEKHRPHSYSFAVWSACHFGLIKHCLKISDYLKLATWGETVSSSVGELVVPRPTRGIYQPSLHLQKRRWGQSTARVHLLP